MSILDRAMEFLKLGISVIPLWHRSKGPMIAWETYKHSPNTEYQLSCWFGSGWNNYGVVAGWNDLAFLDFDDFEAFALWKSYMELMKMAMPYTVLSSRGAHVYISLVGGANQKRRGVDVKFHGYVVGPGSVHPSGAIYQPINELRLAPVESLDAILPAELFPLVAPAVCGQMPAVELTPNTEYNAFDAAVWQGDLISKVKSRARIENFFSPTYKTSADGRWLSALCLFHDDRNPSMWIDTKRQICGCNACNFKPLDVINLYSRIHNLSNHDAVIALAHEIGVWK